MNHSELDKAIGIIDDREPQPAPTPVTPPEVKPTPSPAAEEYEVWWGAYSGWTMLPSWVLCIALVGVILFGAWMFVPKGWIQITVFSMVGAVWLAQLVRWAYRIFGYNYRLTNRRLFRDTGFLYVDRIRIDLKLIKKVEVRTRPYETFFGIGKVLLTTDEALPPIELKGVHQPRVVATLIDECRKQA